MIDRAVGRLRTRTVGAAPGVVFALVGLVSLLLVACGGGDGGSEAGREPEASGEAEASADVGGAGEVIASEDGALELVVPEGALPAGVARASIAAISIPFEWASEEAEAELREESYPVRVFGLQPSGTRFEDPISATVRIPREELNGPLVIWHVSEGEVAPLELALNEDAASDVVEASFSLDSFSELFVVTMYLPSDHLISASTEIDRTEIPVSDQFLASAAVRRPFDDREVTAVLKAPNTDGFRYRDFVSDYGLQPGQIRLETLMEEFEARYRLTFTDELWMLNGTFESSAGAPIVPRELKHPVDHRQTGDLYLTDGHVFRCAVPGEFAINYRASVKLFYSAEPVVAQSGLPSIPAGLHHHGRGYDWAEGRCVEGEEYDGSTVGAIRELLDQSGISSAVGAAIAGFVQDPAAGASCAVDGLSATEWTAAEQAALTSPDARTWPDSVIDKHAEVLERCAPLRPFYESIFSGFDWEDPQCASIMTEWVVDAYPWRVQIEQGVLDPTRRAEGQAAFEQAVLLAYSDTGCIGASA